MEWLKRAVAFQNTLKHFEKEPFLSAIQRSEQNSIVVRTSAELERLGSIQERNVPAQILVSGKKTFQAAKAYKNKRRVAVLNFANYYQPGGLVELGASTQEEELCRCSTLFPVINSRYLKERYYDDSARYLVDAMDIFQCSVMGKCRNYSCAISYVPDILVFKDDGRNNRHLEEKEYYSVDVITSAAPRIPKKMRGRFSKEEKEKYLHLYCERAEMIIGAAAHKGVDVLILGAYGCGAFNNPPELVAKAFAIVSKKYQNCFDMIEYGIYPGEKSENYKIFQSVLQTEFSELIVKK